MGMVLPVMGIAASVLLLALVLAGAPLPEDWDPGLTEVPAPAPPPPLTHADRDAAMAIGNTNFLSKCTRFVGSVTFTRSFDTPPCGAVSVVTHDAVPVGHAHLAWRAHGALGSPFQERCF
ncbi:hypothetical protein C4900_10875 [Acidiferrobacter thiooxydans]|uniref:Uncharacterized protein n=1 Tax=Acidiferrobacter thiooxydans TaxID=163359 RepID=A0A1C2G3A7_9GAMM|nr:hypothetical protein C4900_10875 [Acidiferrobacter thiooxydans]